MGITSKSFEKLHGFATKPVQKTTPNLRSASQFGGIIRKRGGAEAVFAPLVRKASAGDLGTIAKAKDAAGHGSEKRGYSNGGVYGEHPATGKGNQSYAGGLTGRTQSAEEYAAMKDKLTGGGVQQPAPAQPAAAPAQPVNYKSVHQQYKRNEGENHHSENAQLLAQHFGTPEEHEQVKQNIALRDKAGGYSGAEGMAAYRFNNEIDAKYYPKLQEAAGRKTVGKSLGYLGAMRGLAKAKDAGGHGSEKHGGGGAESAAGGSDKISMPEVYSHLSNHFKGLAAKLPLSGDISVQELNMDKVYSDYPDTSPGRVDNLAMEAGLNLIHDKNEAKPGVVNVLFSSRTSLK
jgi:hypothetical protein